MLLSDKFAYFHVPRTAGYSISTALASTLPEAERKTLWRARNIQYCGKSVSGHITPARFCRLKKNGLTGKFVFTFVRNPWDRARSLYYWLFVGRLKRWQPFICEWRDMGFNEWILRDQFQYFIATCTDWPLHQHSYVSYCKKKLDYVGRYENLHDDFSFVCNQLGVKASLEQRHNNKEAVTVSYQEEYNNAARDKIADIFVKDIEYFDYVF